MITIITDTRTEYIDMMEFAMNYICRQLPFDTCGKYGSGHCLDCYKDHHIKCGIRVIEPVDSPAPNEL